VDAPIGQVRVEVLQHHPLPYDPDVIRGQRVPAPCPACATSFAPQRSL